MNLNRVSKLIVVFVMLAAIFAVSNAAPAHADGPADHRSGVVQWFADDSEVPGSSAHLVTNDSGATFTMHTSGLTHGHAVTIWWVLFNNPDGCTGGICDLDDLGNADAGFSVAYGAGHVIGDSGEGNFGGHQSVGAMTGVLVGPGLTNPRDVEVHLVVRTHGPAISGLVAEQISTFGGGCDINVCEDLQFAILK